MSENDQKIIREKYRNLGLYEGAPVLVYTTNLEGVEATIRTINQYGNIFVIYKETQYHDDRDSDERTPYSGQVVHPRQVELIK